MQVYLDNASTTPVLKEVVKVMNGVMIENYGNPSSPHKLGEKALDELNKARIILSKEIRAKPGEIIFTSGATESNNLALSLKMNKKKILISSFEHASVYEYCMHLKEKGYHVSEIPVSNSGQIDLEVLNSELSGAGLLSIIHGHNELGVIQNIKEIAKLCKKQGVLFHVDAVQSFGKIDIDVNWGIDLLSASAHKIGGAKGVGLLYVKSGLEIQGLIGGNQEFGIRAGTQNLPGIIGFAKALEITKKSNWKNVEKLRNEFENRLIEIGGKINCSSSDRLPGHINVSFQKIESEQFVIYLSENGIYCSSRSACDSTKKIENRVLEAIGLKKEQIAGTIRIVLSQNTSKKDLDYAFGKISKFIKIGKK